MFKSLILAALTASSLVAAEINCSDSTIKVQNSGDATALASCESVKGDVQLSPSATSYDLTGLQTIGKGLHCVGCTNVTSIIAPDLKSIGGMFELTSMINLADLSMSKLTSVGSIQFQTLPNLMSMTFGPISKASSVLVTDTVLSNLDAIDLDTCDTYDVNNNRYLKDITSKIKTVTNSFSVSFNAKSVSVSLPNLVWSNNLTFRDVGSLEMPSLATVNGSFGMINCTFDRIEFANLTNVGQSLAIVSDNALTKISFPELTKVGGGFQISNNTKLQTIDGLGKLQSIGGAIDFNGEIDTVKMPKLSDVRGGFNIQTTAQKFDCTPYDTLKSQGEIQGTYACKFALQQNQVGGLGENKGGGQSSSKSGAANVVVNSAAILGSAVISLFYLL